MVCRDLHSVSCSGLCGTLSFVVESAVSMPMCAARRSHLGHSANRLFSRSETFGWDTLLAARYSRYHMACIFIPVQVVVPYTPVGKNLNV